MFAGMMIGLRYTTVKFRTTKDVGDIIDREFNDLFDQWRKLTDEILSEFIERYEIGEVNITRKSDHPYQGFRTSIILTNNRE